MKKFKKLTAQKLSDMEVSKLEKNQLSNVNGGCSCTASTGVCTLYGDGDWTGDCEVEHEMLP